MLLIIFSIKKCIANYFCDKNTLGSSLHRVIAKMLDCSLEVSKFKL